MRCAALAPTRGRYASCVASAVLMLTTPAAPDDGAADVSAANEAAERERVMNATSMMWRDFRMVVNSFLQLLVRLPGMASAVFYPHEISCFSFPLLSSAPPP